MENFEKNINEIKKLALKLKAIAEKGGSENEKYIANKKLNSLLKKYNLSVSDIAENDIKERKFTIKNEDEISILSHIIWKKINPDLKIYRYGKQKSIYCNLSTEDYILIKDMFKFYIDEFNKQKKNFIIAFILKNNLSIKNSNKSKLKDNDIDIFNILLMMSGIENNEYKNNKMIANK